MAILSSPLLKAVQRGSCHFGNIATHYYGAYKESIFYHMGTLGVFFVVFSRSLPTLAQ